MVIMSYTLICLESTTLVIFAKGKCYFVFVRVMDLIDLEMISFALTWQCRLKPGQYEYYGNYDDLEV